MTKLGVLVVLFLILTTHQFPAVAQTMTTNGPNSPNVARNSGSINYNASETNNIHIGTTNEYLDPQRLLSALPSTNCANGILFYSLPTEPNILRPESPVSCKSFGTPLTEPVGTSNALDRLTIDQNSGQVQIEWIGDGVEWAGSAYHDNVSIRIKNTGRVSVEVQEIDQLARNDHIEIMKNDIGFPRTFVLSAGEELLIPLGSMFYIARQLNMGYFDTSTQYHVTTSANSCGPAQGMDTAVTASVTYCQTYGFAVIVNFIDIFGQKKSNTSLAYLAVSRHAMQ